MACGPCGLKRRLSIFSILIFDSKIEEGMPRREAAPNSGNPGHALHQRGFDDFFLVGRQAARLLAATRNEYVIHAFLNEAF